VGGLGDAGYEGPLSLEHEDRSEDPVVGVAESAALINEILAGD
jgi:sugar phosphate isomerase/epimerase